MKVLLIDDHAMFREGIALLLRPLVDELVIWEAGSCDEAFAVLADRGVPDLVLIDIGLPGLSGLEGIGLIRESHPGTAVVALSSSDDRDTVLKALDAGAMGFIPKSSTSALLIGALRLILAKGIYLPPSVFLGPGASGGPASQRLAPKREAGRLAPASSDGSTGAAAGSPRGRRPADLGLTPRQADVLYLILQGKPAKLICRELDLSASTVKSHTSAVLRALNVTTRTQAVVAAGRMGLTFGAEGA